MRKHEYAKLDFPLNVYAHSLFLQEGSVEYLHYGLFDQDESFKHIKIAQQRSSELLIAHLPKPPCHILEVGIGLGTTALSLLQRGYAVTGISPDQQQVRLAQQRTQGLGDFSCSRFEDFTTPRASFDVILFQESSQYIGTLDLLNQSYALLKKNGVILIVDEVLLRPVDNVCYLSSLKHMLAQAKRCGFAVIQQLDLSKQAAPSIDYLLWVLKKQRDRLLTDLDMQANDLDALLASLYLYQQRYSAGNYGYALLKFRKNHQPRWKITPVTGDDKQAVKTLFNDVFKPQQLSESLWQWKYANDRGLGIAAWRDGVMVAHYGGVLRKIYCFNEQKAALQITDVMVLEKERRLFTRRGVFFLTAASFLERNLGFGNKAAFGFGFPNKRAMKIAQLSGLYASVGKIIELHWQARITRPHLLTRVRPLNPTQTTKNQRIVDQLWSSMLSCLQTSLVGVRDWDYISHRYLANPLHSYELLFLTQRLSGKVIALVVLYSQDDVCHIRDIIADLAHIPLIIQQVRRIAALWGMQKVHMWITENFQPLFPLNEAVQEDLEIYIPHNIWSETYPADKIADRWWLMSGDTDFL